MTVTDFRRPSRNAAQAIILCGALLLAACAPQPKGTYQASGKSAVELRSMQTRVVPVGPDEAMRAVIETMQDLGYRITRVAPEARTVSGTRMASLRLAAVVQPRGEDASAVRANASIVSPARRGSSRLARVLCPQFLRAARADAWPDAGASRRLRECAGGAAAGRRAEHPGRKRSGRRRQISNFRKRMNMFRAAHLLAVAAVSALAAWRARVPTCRRDASRDG